MNVVDYDQLHPENVKGSIALIPLADGERGMMFDLVKRASAAVDLVKRASDVGAVGVIIANTEYEYLVMPILDGYKSTIPIPVLVIKSTDIARLRKHGCALLRDNGTSRFFFLSCPPPKGIPDERGGR